MHHKKTRLYLLPLYALCLCVSLLSAARDQILCTLDPKTTTYNAYSDQRPSPDAMQLAGPVNTSLAAICAPRCPRISLFRNPTAANAMMVASPESLRIIYKPEFFTMVYDTYGEPGIQAILGHEVGHAIDSTTKASWMKSDWSAELRADAWAGCSLGKISLSARGLKAAFEVLSKYPPASAPAWDTRVQALRVGFVQCGGDGSKLR